MTLGFRAEDAALAEAGELSGTAYSVELLGDATMVTVKAGGGLVSVKTPKDFRARIGDAFAARIPPEICHLFDHATGERLIRS